MYKNISEVEAALADRAQAEALIAKVDKGWGKASYIPWNETAGLLNRVFGPFGWTTTKVASVDDVVHGIYIYDLELTVYATDEDGHMTSKELTGRGVGVVAQNRLTDGEAHDTAAKAARSDALSVAAKSLGDGFGLFLYDRGDPARSSQGAQTEQKQASSYQRQPQEQSQGQRPAFSGQIKEPGAPATPAQIGALSKFGIDGSQMTKGEASAAIDAAKQGGAAPARTAAPQRARTPDDLDDVFASASV